MIYLKNNTINAFDELFNSFPTTWGKDAQTGYPTASVNIHETDDAYHLELNAPGREKSDFTINVEKGLLTISYEKKEETASTSYKTIRKEFTYRSFKRSFSVDDKINTEAIEARYENGVLKLLLPKKDEVKSSPKQIAVN